MTLGEGTLSDLPVNMSGATSGDDVLYGNAGDDELFGNEGDDLLDGGIGADRMTGGAGIDTFITRAGDSSTILAQADVITDFQNGTDLIGLDGIAFNDLTVEQGTGEYANDTIVSYGVEYLLIVRNTPVSNVTDVDFTPI